MILILTNVAFGAVDLILVGVCLELISGPKCYEMENNRCLSLEAFENISVCFYSYVYLFTF